MSTPIKNRAQHQKSLSWLMPPLLADGLALALLFSWLPAVAAEMLSIRSLVNILLLIIAYVAFCAGVYLLRKLESEDAAPPALAEWLESARVRGAAGLLFGLVMMFAFTYQLGFIEALETFDPERLGSGQSAAFIGLAPAAWLGFSLFYMLILVSDFEPAIAPASRQYQWAGLAGLLANNIMLLVLLAQIGGILAGLGMTSLALYPVVLLLLLLLFGLPRLFYLLRAPHPAGAFSFILLLLIAAWLAL